jgi:hypothetical protein
MFATTRMALLRKSAFCVELVFGEHLREAVHAHDQLVYRFPRP